MASTSLLIIYPMVTSSPQPQRPPLQFLLATCACGRHVLSSQPSPSVAVTVLFLGQCPDLQFLDTSNNFALSVHSYALPLPLSKPMSFQSSMAKVWKTIGNVLSLLLFHSVNWQMLSMATKVGSYLYYSRVLLNGRDTFWEIGHWMIEFIIVQTSWSAITQT